MKGSFNRTEGGPSARPFEVLSESGVKEEQSSKLSQLVLLSLFDENPGVESLRKSLETHQSMTEKPMVKEEPGLLRSYPAFLVDLLSLYSKEFLIP